MSKRPLARRLHALLVPAVLLVWGCGEEAPTMVAPEAQLAKGGQGGGGGGGDDPVVDSVDPSEGDQGQTLDILVSGSAFVDGDEVALGIDGTASDDVVTNATTFVGPNALRANITISGSAEVASYDVIVSGGRGRKGIGTALFAVKLAPHANAVVTDLGSLGGSSQAFDLNDLGEVVGRSTTDGGPTHAFYWDPDDQVMVDLHPLLSPGSYSWAFAINNAGQVTGQHNTVGGTRAFVLDLRSGSALDLQSPDGLSEARARDINDAGHVVGGFGASSTETGFLWDGSVMKPLQGLVGGSGVSRPQAINEAGHVVGASYGASGAPQAVMWLDTDATPTNLTGAAEWAYAYGVSDPVDGVVYVSGQSDPGDHDWATLWTVNVSDGSFTVEYLAAHGYAFEVNAGGSAVGPAGTLSRAYLWRTSGSALSETLELGSAFGRGGSWAYAINASGAVAGFAHLSTKGKEKGLEHAVIWTLPE